MNKYIIFIIVPFLLYGCAVNKKINSTNHQIDSVSIEMATNTTSSSSASSNQIEKSNTDEITIECIEEQIIDSVKKITTNRKISREIRVQKNRAYQKTDTLYNHIAIIDTTTYHQISTSSSNSIEDIKESQLPKYIAIICICIVIILALIFLKNLLHKILKFFA